MAATLTLCASRKMLSSVCLLPIPLLCSALELHAHVFVRSYIWSIYTTDSYYYLMNFAILMKLMKIRNVLTDQSASQLIHALISSRIDYCNSILYGMSDSVISDLQHIQNTAARILAKCGNSFIHSKIILKKLHWLPIKQRIVYKILITTYKAYHSIAPKYICDLITRREYKRELRTNDQMNLVVPFVKRKHFGERSFSYAAPREWNKLELSIRKSESLESFKKKIKTYLFEVAYK